MSTNDPNVVDLGSIEPVVYTYDNMSCSGGFDTITLDPSQFISAITVPSYTSIGNTYTTSIGATGSTYTIGTGAGANGTYWTTATGTTNITGNGIELDASADIKIGHKSFKAIMEKIEDRLAILTPDPVKLEKFAALKKAYEHYKLMEKLCQEEDKEDK